MRGRLLVVLGLLILLAGALVTAKLTQVPAAPLWAIVATAGIGLVTTLFTNFLSSTWTDTLHRHSSRRADLVRNCLSDGRGSLPRLKDVTDPLPLGVRPTRASGADPATPGMTAYVSRDLDKQLDDAVRHGGLVVIVGPEISGKTRSAYEAVRRAHPRRTVIAPRDAAALGDVLDAGVPYGNAVVWLDRLERFVHRDGLDLYRLVLASPGGRRPGVVVATIGADVHRRLATGVDCALAAEALSRSTVLMLPAQWSPDELNRARLAATTDDVLAYAIQRVGGGANPGVPLLAYVAPAQATAVVSDIDAAAGPTIPRPRQPAMPPAPHCTDRESHVAELVAALCANPPLPSCVLGAPGIGKTTIVRVALHDHHVAERYGPRRIFVRGDGATKPDAIVAELGTQLRLPLGPDLLEAVIEELGRSPAIVALDGLEGAWESDTLGTEELTGRLAAVPGVGLTSSVRGAALPIGVPWLPVRVPRLDHADARDLFLAFAGAEFLNDPHLTDLVAAQDGMPLALELLARSAQGEPNLNGLWRRWTVHRSSPIADDSAGYHRLDVSVELAVKSVRMNAPALRLLSMLGALPDGVDCADLDVLMPATGDVAAGTLRKVGLAFDEQGRLRTLAPIREYVARRLPPDEGDRATLLAHYAELAASLGLAVGGRDGAAASSRLVAESGNLEVALTEGLGGADPAPAARAICALGEFTRYTGIGGLVLLEQAAVAAGAAGDVLLEGECLYRLGDVALRQSRHQEAVAYLRQALPLLRRAGNGQWVATCVKHIGDVAYEQSDYGAAREHFQRAHDLYGENRDRRGQAHCIKCLGDVAKRRSRYGEAADLYRRALADFTELGDELGQADCMRRLGDVHIVLRDAEAAAESYAAASQLYERAGAVLGLANCVLGRGWVALHRGDLQAVAEQVNRAEPLYARMKYVRGQALCVATLGQLALAHGDHTAAAEQFRCAAELFETVNDQIGLADAHLGIAEATDDAAEALRLSTTALRTHLSLDRPDGVAGAHSRLAALADDPRTRDEHLRAATEAWRRIGREDRIQDLAQEFPGM